MENKEFKKKTIATITYHRSDNYGSVLQAYALQKALQREGYDAFLIDYRKESVRTKYQILQPLSSKYNLITDIYSILYYRKLCRKKNRFEKFRQEQLCLTAPYMSNENLKSNPPATDVYVVGSDQVWNTYIDDFDMTYFLDFAGDGKKIAYAASGTSKPIQDDLVGTIKRYLCDFSAVSVREQSVAEFFSDIYPSPISHVADPVLLLSREEWLSITHRPKKEKYLLCYFAGGVSADFEYYTSALAKRMGLKRVLLMPEWRNLFRNGMKAYDFGPEEFLSWIAHADIVCTNSFHGTAFSIIFERPFVVGMHKPYGDARVENILELSNLTEREIDPANPHPLNFTGIDFATAKEKISEFQKSSLEWLINNIEA